MARTYLDGAAPLVAVLQQDQYRYAEARPPARPDAGADAARADIGDAAHYTGHSVCRSMGTAT